MVEGIEHLLRCDIVNVAPVQNLTVRWYRGSEPVHTEMFQNKHADAPKTPQNQSFILRVSPERGHNGARYRCEAELHLGPEIPEPVSSTSQPYIAVVHCELVLLTRNKLNIHAICWILFLIPVPFSPQLLLPLRVEIAVRR